MAKINHILFGQGKGKVGGLVLQRYEGMNIAREKPISVKNPQSKKQTEGRAKFKMSSQIVAQFKDVFDLRLAELSIYTRTRRAQSVNAIYKIVDTTIPDNPSALVASVVNAINAKNVSGILAPDLNVSNNNVSIVMDAGYTVTFTVAAYDTNSGDLITKKTETYTSDGTAKNVDIFPGARNVIMAVAYRALTEQGRADISNTSVNNSAWTNTIARSVNAGDIEISNMSGMYIVGA